MNKVYCLTIVLCLTLTVLGMEKSSSPINIRSNSRDVVIKKDSNGSLSNSPLMSFRAHFPSDPNFPCGAVDGKVIPSQKRLVQQDKK